MKSSLQLIDSSGREFVIYTDKRLGQGTFAEVFAGEWTNTPLASTKKVAIKRFRSATSKQEIIDKEIDIMRALNHPNIVKLISAIRQEGDNNAEDSEEDGSQLYVVLEFCAGGDFRRYIKGKRLSEKWARIYLLQIAAGIEYLHNRDIIHRDLKPHNMLLSEDKKNLKIADFGFARVIGNEALTATLCGSPLYMAPEVLRGDSYGAKADLWSVGVILYEMVCGERPFHDVASIVELKKQLLSEPIRFPSKVKDNISHDCRRLLNSLLQKDPSKRIQFSAFFNHDWLQQSEPAVLSKETASQFSIPASRPILIPSQPQLRLNIINNYVDHLSSAPARTTPPIPIPAATPPQSGASVFLSTTPQGRSEPTYGHTFPADTSQSASESRSTSRIASAFTNVMTTGFGLLRDSFQSGNY